MIRRGLEGRLREYLGIFPAVVLGLRELTDELAALGNA